MESHALKNDILFAQSLFFIMGIRMDGKYFCRINKRKGGNKSPDCLTDWLCLAGLAEVLPVQKEPAEVHGVMSLFSMVKNLCTLREQTALVQSIVLSC